MMTVCKKRAHSYCLQDDSLQER